MCPGKNLSLAYISESRAQAQTFQEQTLGVELGHKSLAEMSPNQVIQRKVKYTWKAAIFLILSFSRAQLALSGLLTSQFTSLVHALP